LDQEKSGNPGWNGIDRLKPVGDFLVELRPPMANTIIMQNINLLKIPKRMKTSLGIRHSGKKSWITFDYSNDIFLIKDKEPIWKKPFSSTIANTGRVLKVAANYTNYVQLLQQGCQIFHGTIHRNGEKYTQ
jgi:hypothetical protein